MTVVTEQLALPDGTAPGGWTVTITLAGENGETIEGFNSDDDETVIGRVRTSLTAGSWSTDLTPNDSITPAGSVYKRTITGGGGVGSGGTTHSDYFSVPDGGGPYVLEDLLTDVPGALPSPQAVTQAILTAAIDAEEDRVDALVETLGVNVVTYGADRTGTTDSATAIQAAITAAAASAYKAVLIPAGTYLIGSQLTIPTGVQVFGAGKYVCTLQVTADVIGVLLDDGNNSLQGVYMQAGVATTKAAIQIGDGTNPASNWHVRDVRVDRLSGSLKFATGIKGAGAFSGSIDGCLVDSCSSYGIWLDDITSYPPNAIRVTNCNVANAATADIRVESSNGGVYIAGTTVQGTSPKGIWLVSCVDVVLDGNYYENGGASSVGVDMDACTSVNVLGGHWESSTLTTMDIDSSCAEINIWGVNFTGSTAHLVNNTGSTVRAYGGSFDSSKCTGVSPSSGRFEPHGVRDTYASAPGGQNNPHTRLKSLGILGLTGATAASRYVGATASGAPGSGTFAVGDFVIDQTGVVYVCTVAGTPGTWLQAGKTLNDAAYRVPNEWLRVSDFEIASGTPAVTTSNNNPCWAFDAASEERVNTTFFQPQAWATFDVDLWWTNLGAGAGDVRWQLQSATLVDTGTTASPGIVATSNVTAPAQNVAKVTSLATGLTMPTGNQLMILRVLRIAADAGDTLANDAGMFGLRLKRAS